MKINNLFKLFLLFWMGIVIVASFLYAKPASGFSGEISRLMFYHIPQAWIATIAFLISMVYSVKYLSKRQVNHDLMASTAAELGFLFCILATITGSIFAKSTWGAYWNWDPRETSIIILLSIYGAYFALRSAVPEPERKRILSAAYAILAFATVPFLIFILPRITLSLHPEDTMNPVELKMDQRFMLVFFSSLLAFTGLFAWIFNLKYRLEKIQYKLTNPLEESEEWTTD